MLRHPFPASLLAAASLALCAAALAQAYPTKPVHIVVPYPAGGAVDVMSRVFAQKYNEAWGQPVIVDNRAGAGGNVGADAVAKSAPDGYTWLMNTSGQAIAPGLYKKLNYDPVKDLVPVTQLVTTSLILVTSPQLQAATPRDLVALIRSRPGEFNFGSTGIGSAPHLNGEMFKTAERLELTHVPYKGDAQLFPALFVNEVQLAFVPPQTGLALIRAGKVKALAVTGTNRSSSLPDVPTMKESGVPGVEYNGWISFFVPTGTPRDLVNRIAGEAARILKAPDVMKYYPGWGVDAVGSTPEQFAPVFRAEVEKFARVIRDAKIPQAD
jgi:tripartite-type tricarboxylate transporter receptor subunit TctC